MNALALQGDAACGVGTAPGPLSSVGVQRWADGQLEPGLDWAAEEVPVSLEYNGIAHAVMMATPAELDELALGFSLSEGIVGSRQEVLDIQVSALSQGMRVALQITARRERALKERRRSLAGRTGCGLCGVQSLDQVLRPLPPVPAGTPLDAALFADALQAMEQAQTLRAIAGATHAAAWMDAGGQLLWVREDVGRHNALDKVLGAMARAGADPGAGALLLSSRASYEMVHKAAALGIGLVVAVSAPTALAIRVARELRLTLAGFARGGRHVVYTHAARLQGLAVEGGAQ